MYPIAYPVLVSNKYFSYAGEGSVVGANLIISSINFTNDNGDSPSVFSLYSYFNLFINGILQPNGVVILTPTQVLIVGGGLLEPSNPIIIELVLLQMSPPSNPKIFTTGPILNSGATPSRKVDVMISNDDTTTTATVELEAFEVTISPTGTAKVGAAHQLFTVPPLTVATRTINITGFPGYEIQLNVTGANVVIDTFTLDIAGDLNAAQRVLQSETTIIAALTPIP
jgi:hypothetical protein